MTLVYSFNVWTWSCANNIFILYKGHYQVASDSSSMPLPTEKNCTLCSIICHTVVDKKIICFVGRVALKNIICTDLTTKGIIQSKLFQGGIQKVFFTKYVWQIFNSQSLYQIVMYVLKAVKVNSATNSRH